MKVVIPAMSLETGGGCKILVEIANALHASGHDTEMVVPSWSPIVYDVKCKLTKVPKLEKDNIPYGDIVLANFYSTFKPAYEAWPNQCVRLCQGFEPLWVKDKDYALWTYSHDIPIISVSHWLDDQIFQHTNKRSAAIVNLGLDPNIFYPGSNHNNDNKRKVILYIARDPKLGYQLKGYDDFVKSMEIFQKEYNGKFVVHMVCTETILPLPGIPHRTFRPKTDQEMADLYRSADIFVSTSWIEGFGLPPLEAMACQTPVVTTNSGGILDFCRHLKSAYITKPKDPKAIAAGIKEVLTNKKLAETLAYRGLKSASKLTKSNFEKKIVKALEDIYSKRTS
jgi:glycosyltransferase involved in cell wall biosynthesis